MKSHLLLLWLGATLLTYFGMEYIWNPSAFKVLALVFVAGSFGFNLSSLLWRRMADRRCAELSRGIHRRSESDYGK